MYETLRVITARKIQAMLLMMLSPALPSYAIESARQSAPAKPRITIASGVRLRTSPAVTAEEVARLQIGVVVQELEQSASKEKIGGGEDYWYRVSTPDGKEGWVFGAFTQPFDPNKRAETYRRIAAERLKVDSATFADLVDLTGFLSRSTAEVTPRDILAELELARLIAIKRALALIPFDKLEQPLYQNWIKALGDSLVYSEPAGQWLVKSDLFWELQKKYGSLSIAERIAWEAANNPLPGECEGFIPCALDVLTLTGGRYLELYPRGAHSEEALDDLSSSLEGIDELAKNSDPLTAQDRTEIQKSLALLRAIITQTASPKKARLLERINRYAQRFR